MDPAAKKLWVTALRSREYRQGRGQLCDKDGKMCCLGVLIDVTQDGEWEFDSHAEGYAYLGMMGLLPLGVREQVGLTDYEMKVLADLNDRKLSSFRKISAHIEATL